ncbi:MAG: hypothetical protein KTR29_13610 [Rhodothermaceae bacterium]|nr:hypothetical protein [Rhodothermaceae bacterium]
MNCFKHLLLLVAGFFVIESAFAQPDKWGLPSSPNGTLIAALLDAVNDSDASAHRTFIESHFTSEFQNAMPMENHLEQFQRMHEDLTGGEVNGVDMRMTPDGSRTLMVVLVTPEDEYWNLSLDVQSADPPKIAGMNVEMSPDGPPPVERVIRTLMETINDSDPEAHRTFIETYYSPAFKNDFPMEEHLQQFQQLHKDLAGANPLSVEAMSQGGTDETISMLMETESGSRFKLEFDLQTTTTPPRLISLSVQSE